MDDEVLVRVAAPPRRPARRARSRCADAERARPSQYAVDRPPVDVLHDEVGLAVLGGAAVEQPRDVRVIERRRGSAARRGSGGAPASVSMPALDQLDRDALLELVVGAHGHVHRAHAAAPISPHEPVRADPAADASRAVIRPRAGDSKSARAPAASRSVAGSRQCRRAGVAPRAAAPHRRRRPRRGMRRARAAGSRARRRTALGRPARHRAGVIARSFAIPRSSRWSQARATRQSRLTVAGDTPRTSAVSSTSSPPKKRSSTTCACRGSSAASSSRPSSSASRSTDGPVGSRERVVEGDAGRRRRLARRAAGRGRPGSAAWLAPRCRRSARGSARSTPLIHEPEVGLVDQRGGLQRVIGTLAPE